MSRMQRTVSIARSALSLRPIVMRPALMTRGYPSRSEMNEADPKVSSWGIQLIQKLETEKQANLKGNDKASNTIEHAPGWNEVLASESEANIKAEKEDLSNLTVKEMQEKTIKHVKEKHH